MCGNPTGIRILLCKITSLLKFLWSAAAKLEAETVAETTKLQGRRNTQIIPLLQFIYWMSKIVCWFCLIWVHDCREHPVESKILSFYLIGAPLLCSGWFCITCLNPRSSLKRSKILVRLCKDVFRFCFDFFSLILLQHVQCFISRSKPQVCLKRTSGDHLNLKKKKRKALYIFILYLLCWLNFMTLTWSVKSRDLKSSGNC